MHIREMVAAIRPLMKGIDRRIVEIAVKKSDDPTAELKFMRYHPTNGLILTTIEDGDNTWSLVLFRDGTFARLNARVSQYEGFTEHTHRATKLTSREVHAGFSDRQIQDYLLAILDERHSQAQEKLAAIQQTRTFIRQENP